MCGDDDGRFFIDASSNHKMLMVFNVGLHGTRVEMRLFFSIRLCLDAEACD